MYDENAYTLKQFGICEQTCLCNTCQKTLTCNECAYITILSPINCLQGIKDCPFYLPEEAPQFNSENALKKATNIVLNMNCNDIELACKVRGIKAETRCEKEMELIQAITEELLTLS